MFTKILVPVAFTRYSQGILKFAYEMAQPHNAELVIANVINERDLEAVERIASFGYKVDGDHYVSTIQKERVEKLEKILEELSIPEEKYSFALLAGDPTTELLKYIVEKDIDLVIMGTKVNDIKHIFIGSVAERMFRRCPVPVVYYRGEDLAKRLIKKIEREFD